LISFAKNSELVNAAKYWAWKEVSTLEAIETLDIEEKEIVTRGDGGMQYGIIIRDP
jgi:hypothetical protein